MNLAAVYPEMQSDFDFCLDTIKAFCASNFILGGLLLIVRLILKQQWFTLKLDMYRSTGKH